MIWIKRAILLTWINLFSSLLERSSMDVLTASISTDTVTVSCCCNWHWTQKHNSVSFFAPHLRPIMVNTKIAERGCFCQRLQLTSDIAWRRKCLKVKQKHCESGETNNNQKLSLKNGNNFGKCEPGHNVANFTMWGLCAYTIRCSRFLLSLCIFSYLIHLDLVNSGNWLAMYPAAI